MPATNTYAELWDTSRWFLAKNGQTYFYLAETEQEAWTAFDTISELSEHASSAVRRVFLTRVANAVVVMEVGKKGGSKAFLQALLASQSIDEERFLLKHIKWDEEVEKRLGKELKAYLESDVFTMWKKSALKVQKLFSLKKENHGVLPDASGIFKEYNSITYAWNMCEELQQQFQFLKFQPYDCTLILRNSLTRNDVSLLASVASLSNEVIVKLEKKYAGKRLISSENDTKKYKKVSAGLLALNPSDSEDKAFFLEENWRKTGSGHLYFKGDPSLLTKIEAYLKEACKHIEFVARADCLLFLQATNGFRNIKNSRQLVTYLMQHAFSEMFFDIGAINPTSPEEAERFNILFEDTLRPLKTLPVKRKTPVEESEESKRLRHLKDSLLNVLPSSFQEQENWRIEMHYANGSVAKFNVLSGGGEEKEKTSDARTI